MRAIQAARTGGAEVLECVDLPQPVAGLGEILVRHKAIGLNFIDIYQRTGLYPTQMPVVLGREAAGVVETLGDGVTRFRPGDRVAYVNGSGAYADFGVIASDQAVLIPAAVTFEMAAAAMLKGMTAEFLARRIWPLSPRDAVLVHAAAGGVGSILTQWLHHLGMRVIGAVGTTAKAAVARTRGCVEVIVYDQEDISSRVRDLTGGDGVKVVFDSVGANTLHASLDSLSKRGLFVSFGNASGPVPPIAPLELSRRGSLFMTRPSLFDYIATPEALDASARALFGVIASGAVAIDIGQRRPLSEARRAHQDLETRQTTGATVLIP